MQYLDVVSIAGAIEQFNRKEQEAHSKTDNIILMVNLPLGTFEYDKNADVVTCSGTFLELIDLSVEEHTVIASQLFFQKINEIKENVEDKQNNIYMLNNNTHRWLKLVFIDRDNTILGICMDVTKEVLDNHAIKFEHDHDILTNLLMTDKSLASYRGQVTIPK